jgi:hypothetical protein
MMADSLEGEAEARSLEGLVERRKLVCMVVCYSYIFGVILSVFAKL